MINPEKILSLIDLRGPVLPADVAKNINLDIIFASAYLSDLVDQKKIKVSHTKIGGSPVYYKSGQETKLQQLYENLNEKDKRAFDLVKEKKVVNEETLTPLMRVALGSIKDFAIPLVVTHGDKKTTFWKWYLLSEEETNKIINSELENGEAAIAEKEKIKQKEADEVIEKQRVEQEKIALGEQKRKLEEERSRLDAERRKMEESRKLERISLQKREEELKRQAKSAEVIKKQVLRKTDEAEIFKDHGNAAKDPKELKDPKDPFFLKLKEYLDEKEISLRDYNLIKPKSELDMFVAIPTVVGHLEYYCKAKNKKKINDSDLNSAFVQGQLKQLPVLFLTTGELTKKAEELLSKEFKKSMVVQKI